MIFEAAGLGTARFDACTCLGAPNAIVTLHTQLVNVADVKPYSTELLQALAELWDGAPAPVIRMQIYADHVSESCYTIVLDQVNTARFSAQALAAYRSILAKHRTGGPQPPVTHDTCFLPSGHTVQFQGRA